ncbi:helix-turn-helix transcriptional regulator [Lentzea sp. NPDC051213]|uniref:helix-turn-helix transcriptional regulator n=1 Tax=Lentzea sp. NPDC051213 TaxID=3364126 RepID=UPI0037953672
MDLGAAPDAWVGREPELAVLRQAVERLSLGVGSAVWVEGEPGIGKSALVRKAVDEAKAAGCEVLVGAADSISQRSPLHVMLDLLQVWPRSPDPRRHEIARLLSERRFGLLETADVPGTDIELLAGLVDELCTAGPVVLAVDDLQHLDETSFLLWHRLVAAVDQLPLLLITTARPAPQRRETDDLRAVFERRGHPLLVLEPLAEAEAAQLLDALAAELSEDVRGALRSLAAGNPLYLRELADAARRDGTLRDGGQLPTSFAEALWGRLRVVPAGAVEVLRAAALLGSRFVVAELVVLTAQPAADVVLGLQEAFAADIVVDSGGQLAFRHPLIRQALYEEMPLALRAARHREAAQALAESGSGALRVAEQLLASDEPGGMWTRRWLAENATALAAHAPEIVAELLSREADHSQAGGEAEVLIATLAWVLLGVGRYDEAVARARQGLAVVTLSTRRAEMYFVLVRSLFSLGRNTEAVEAARRALSRTDLSFVWRARLLVPLAMYQRAGEGDLETAEATGKQALHLAESVRDTFAIAYALTVLWTTHSVRRDHQAALAFVDRSLEVLSAGPEHSDLLALAQDARIFTLQNLARWDDAAAALREERDGGGLRPAGLRRGVTAAVLLYWLGSWDDALAEFDSDHFWQASCSYAGLREPGPTQLLHGVGALIAARRDERDLAAARIGAGSVVPISTIGERENQDFLMAASSVLFEQEGDAQRAMTVLADTALNRLPGEMTLTHQWLPDLVRLALDVGDQEVVQAALTQAQAEAEAETASDSGPARATAALWRCEGLAQQDPAPLRDAVEHYRTAGPPVELAGALEDLAAVCASRGEQAEAKDALHEAVTRYADFGAEWDVLRADRRLRELGVRRGVRGPREQRDVSGWGSLTPTEVRIAELVAEGRSTPAIAASLFLSRRTVQTYISHILGKLGASGRVDIARIVFESRAAKP